ncbi:hypothetical protein LTR36_003148 [Oleoguttula mirabilis]|uniref:Uncharacterized protein n=1 Tax=Oleoguttula mirabilis TaxID=1507867 RepID=A0AAV9JYM5_9PEZI|nr:hypothetical protein LTR36_003148 [Oleoguttula mirabilis]
MIGITKAQPMLCLGLPAGCEQDTKLRIWTRAVSLNTSTLAQAKQIIANARAIAKEGGRDLESLEFIPCLVPFLGKTEDEAKQNVQTLSLGISMAQFLLDEAIDLTGHAQAAAIQSVFKALSALEERLAGAKWTPRRLAIKSMLMEFRMTTGGTFRENPLATKHLRDDHYGRSFKWPNEGPSQKEEALKQRETSAMVPIPATKESKAEPVKHAPVRPMAAPRAQATYEVR